MKNKQELDRKVEQTLRSLDNLQQLEANEFLYAKILHRMSGNNNTAIYINYSKVMVRLAAVLCLLVCINCISFFVLKQQPVTTKVTAAKTSGADAFAEAYGLNNNLNSY